MKTVLGVVLGAIFLYASYDKIAHPGEFARIVYHYRLIGPSQQIGPWASNLLAVTLPWVEVLVGLSLITGVWRREGALVATALLLVFVGAVSAALVRGIDIENCGCFSVTGAGRGAGLKLILGDAAMLAAALLLVRPEASGAMPAETRPAAAASA